MQTKNQEVKEKVERLGGGTIEGVRGGGVVKRKGGRVWLVDAV